MGILYNGKCYETELQAKHAFFTSIQPEFLQQGTSTTLFLYPHWTNTTWRLCLKPMNLNAASCIDAPAFSFPTCTYVADETFNPPFASGVFVLFFAAVVTVYVISLNIGAIIQAVRRW
jgi:hypothetical protein